MAYGQPNNRQKDIGRVLREKNSRLKILQPKARVQAIPGTRDNRTQRQK